MAWADGRQPQDSYVDGSKAKLSREPAQASGWQVAGGAVQENELQLHFLWVGALRLPAEGEVAQTFLCRPQAACLPSWPVHILPLSRSLPATWAACPGPLPVSSITEAGKGLGWISWSTLPSLGRAPSSFRC